MKQGEDEIGMACVFVDARGIIRKEEEPIGNVGVEWAQEGEGACGKG